MLYRIEIENFFSIGDSQVIDLRARKSVEDILDRLSPIFKGSRDRAPNVVAIFGPNASGKSNILRAVSFGVWFLTDSFHAPLKRILPYQKFASHENIGKPTRLSFTLSGPVDFNNISDDAPQCPYIYELVLSPRLQDERVMLEKLSYQPKGFGKPTTIFERIDGEIEKSVKGFMRPGDEKNLKNVLRPNVSVLATLAQLNHAVSISFVHYVKASVTNIFIDRFEHGDQEMTRWYAENPDALSKLEDMANRIDLGIEEIKIDNSSETPRLLFTHSGLDQVVSLERESHGTKQFLKIFPYIFIALERGSLAVIDEIDTAIHPLLLPEILRWFGDPVRNRYGAQLFTSCHAASLLSELTKEEVLFCEKDDRGYTSVFSLADIEGVRRNENFFGKYIGGEYGAVPVVG